MCLFPQFYPLRGIFSRSRAAHSAPPHTLARRVESPIVRSRCNRLGDGVRGSQPCLGKRGAHAANGVRHRRRFRLTSPPSLGYTRAHLNPGETTWAVASGVRVAAAVPRSRRMPCHCGLRNDDCWSRACPALASSDPPAAHTAGECSSVLPPAAARACRVVADLPSPGLPPGTANAIALSPAAPARPRASACSVITLASGHHPFATCAKANGRPARQACLRVSSSNASRNPGDDQPVRPAERPACPGASGRP